MPTLRNKIGLAIAVLLAIGDVVSAFQPTPDAMKARRTRSCSSPGSSA